MNSKIPYESLLLEGKLASPGLVSGTFFLHPRGNFIWESIKSFINREFNELGVKNVLFPSLIPWSKFLEERELNKTLDLDEIIRLHSDSNNVHSISALRPTSEILFSHFFRERIKERSEKLPLLLNQWSSVYRSEKNTKLFFRSKEFYWQELHSIHDDELEAREYLLKIHNVYTKLIRDILCIYPVSGEKTKLERFSGAEQTLSNECILPDGQVLQLTTSHYLGTFFAELMKIKNVHQIEKPLVQLSAGCSTRLIGAIVEMHKDSVGIILPWNLSQEQIAIVFLNECSEEEIEKISLILKEKLKDYRLHWDTTDHSFGKKINKIEKLGIPLTLIIGKEELSSHTLTVKSRLSSEKYKCNLENIESEIIKYRDSFQSQLIVRSKEFAQNLIKTTSSWEELVELISQGNVVISPWEDSDENELNFKNKKYNFSIRCIKERLDENNNLKCVFSNREANCLVYFGRSY